MTKFGYKLMTEEHGPAALVANAKRAEDAGFDFVSISDHFHPWLKAQGHSPFAWSVLGAIAHVTDRVGITTGLTCPIIRYHPAIIAQAAATIAVMSGGRFSLSVGGGERLNEHVTGERWPSTPERHAMLREAIAIFRLLWSGGVHSFQGDWYDIDHAQIYDLPEQPITLTVGVSGKKSVSLAADAADGIMATTPDAELVKDFRSRSESDGPAYGEATLAWAPSVEEGMRIAHERLSFGMFDWSVNSELRDVAGFEAATKFVRPDDVAKKIPCGPDPEIHLAEIQKWIDAGFDHIALLGPGDDQAGFIAFCESELLPKLR